MQGTYQIAQEVSWVFFTGEAVLKLSGNQQLSLVYALLPHFPFQGIILAGHTPVNHLMAINQLDINSQF